MAHEGEGDARVGAERVVTCGINTINNTMNNTINNTTDREGCRDVGRDVGRDGGRVQTKTEEEGWIGRDGTSEPKGWGACRKIKK